MLLNIPMSLPSCSSAYLKTIISYVLRIYPEDDDIFENMPLRPYDQPSLPPFSQRTSTLLLKSLQSTLEVKIEKSFSEIDFKGQSSFNPNPNNTQNEDASKLHLPILYRDSMNHLLEVKDNVEKYVEHELDVSRLNEIHKYLWVAGRPMSARPLHRQNMMGREIVVVEQTDLHLTWTGKRIFVKPLPPFLLSYMYWKAHICPSKALHSRAMGLLLSYVWLVCQPSDLKVAIDCGLLPPSITWQQWLSLVGELVRNIDMRGLSNVNKRYMYGELRLARLNKIYMFAPEFKLKHFMRGYQSRDTVYGSFFEREFAWLLILFVYISIMLSSAQLGLATDKLQHSLAFQRISLGLTMLFIFLPVICLIFIIIWFLVLLCFHLMATLSFQKSQSKARGKARGGKSDTSV